VTSLFAPISILLSVSCQCLSLRLPCPADSLVSQTASLEMQFSEMCTFCSLMYVYLSTDIYCPESCSCAFNRSIFTVTMYCRMGLHIFVSLSLAIICPTLSLLTHVAIRSLSSNSKIDFLESD